MKVEVAVGNPLPTGGHTHIHTRAAGVPGGGPAAASLSGQASMHRCTAHKTALDANECHGHVEENTHYMYMMDDMMISV